VLVKVEANGGVGGNGLKAVAGAGSSAQAWVVRFLALGAVVAACGRPDLPAARAPAGGDKAGAQAAAVEGPPPNVPIAPPGGRLASGIAPVSYDLKLELDPDRDAFAGRVEIAISVAPPGTARVWLHADQLELRRVTLRGERGEEPATLLEGEAGTQLRGIELPWAVGPGTITLTIDYTGRIAELPRGTKQEGLFRERSGGRWYLYSQAESMFARRIAPCFDEPRFKSTWRVTAVVPKGAVALGNGAAAVERALPDGRREVRFAEIAALPSYLLALAVGPFELVDAGRIGRRKIPARIAVLDGDGARVKRALRELPRIVDELERYVDAPLPIGKLDLVAVPEFFGAMENPGLITIRSSILTSGREFVWVTAHELAHQWFGNAVTPAWWDELWLSESFASWLGTRVTAALGAERPDAVLHGDRVRALEADDAIGARPLIHPVAAGEDVEPGFDAIIYEKGAAVLAGFERYAGQAAFQTAVRRYLAEHAGKSVTSRAFLDALAAATQPEIAAALAGQIARAGAPVVELSLRCDRARATLVAAARDGLAAPVCVRFPLARGKPADTDRACVLAGARSELVLPAAAGCPAWLVGNDGGRGYYHTVWRGAPAEPPRAAVSTDERLARGDDVAAAIRRGELAAPAALAALTALAAPRDPASALAAIEVAGAIDAFADPVRPAWTAWLARRFAERLAPGAMFHLESLSDALVYIALVDLVRGALDPAVVGEARDKLAREPAGEHFPRLRAIAAVRDGGALFDAQVARAAAATDAGDREAALEELGELTAGFAPRVVDLVAGVATGATGGATSGATTAGKFAAAEIWPALAAMIERGDTRLAAWRAIHGRFAALTAALGGDGTREAIVALAALCDPAARAELAADTAPLAAAARASGKAARGPRRISDRYRDPTIDRTIDRTLATIDRCIARRAAFGDLGAALAASDVAPTAPPPPSR
jgi:alanyl aminopeptidase